VDTKLCNSCGLEIVEGDYCEDCIPKQQYTPYKLGNRIIFELSELKTMYWKYGSVENDKWARCWLRDTKHGRMLVFDVWYLKEFHVDYDIEKLPEFDAKFYVKAGDYSLVRPIEAKTEKPVDDETIKNDLVKAIRFENG